MNERSSIAALGSFRRRGLYSEAISATIILLKNVRLIIQGEKFWRRGKKLSRGVIYSVV